MENQIAQTEAAQTELDMLISDIESQLDRLLGITKDAEAMCCRLHGDAAKEASDAPRPVPQGQIGRLEQAKYRLVETLDYLEDRINSLSQRI